MRMRGQEEIKDQLIVGRCFDDQELNDMSSSKVYSYVLGAGLLSYDGSLVGRCGGGLNGVKVILVTQARGWEMHRALRVTYSQYKEDSNITT